MPSGVFVRFICAGYMRCGYFGAVVVRGFVGCNCFAQDVCMFVAGEWFVGRVGMVGSIFFCHDHCISMFSVRACFDACVFFLL